MNVQGECIIGASREVVWSAINRIDLLRLSIPGCLELQESDDGRLLALVKLKVGVMSVKFKGSVSLEDICEPHSYTIVGQGDGGVAGFARGSSRVTLEEAGPSITKLSFDADASVGGKLASVGGRLLDATARKLTNKFFENFCAALTAEGLARELEPVSQ
jgi:hypothetical protein